MRDIELIDKDYDRIHNDAGKAQHVLNRCVEVVMPNSDEVWDTINARRTLDFHLHTLDMVTNERSRYWKSYKY